jgi:hypothetical protein
MLFWLAVIAFVVGIIMRVIMNKKRWWKLDCASLFTILVSSIVLVIMIIILCCQHIGIDARVEKNFEIYNAIEYKVTSGACRDELGLLSKEVIDEVQNWNKDVKYYQAVQDDFWIGIFYPNVFDQFETIDYMSYNTGD